MAGPRGPMPGHTTRQVDYRLLAELLVQSLEQDPNVRSVVDAAFAAGQRAGDAFPRNVVEALRSCGYLPRRPVGAGTVRSTPSRGHTKVLCGLNLRLVEGVLAGCGETDAHADLDPHPNRCCVVINPIT